MTSAWGDSWGDETPDPPPDGALFADGWWYAMPADAPGGDLGGGALAKNVTDALVLGWDLCGLPEAATVIDGASLSASPGGLTIGAATIGTSSVTWPVSGGTAGTYVTTLTVTFGGDAGTTYVRSGTLTVT